jgi:hypothetical protein
MPLTPPQRRVLRERRFRPRISRGWCHYPGAMPRSLQPGEAGSDWTRAEVLAAVDEYFRLFDAQLAQKSVNKRQAYEDLHVRFPHRSATSFEFKFRNISAVLDQLNLPWLRGLAPASNSQGLLFDEVEARLEQRVTTLQRLAEAAGIAPELPHSSASSLDGEDSIVAPPKPLEHATVLQRPVVGKIDYIARESRNRDLGRAGEIWTVELERHRLRNAGRHDLAERVVHTAESRGDGLGFDIESFDARTEEPRLIEVKSTRSGIRAPFFLTSNEVRASKQYTRIFRLYRVHSFGIRTRVYILEGDVTQSCWLDPTVFRALPRTA